VEAGAAFDLGDDRVEMELLNVATTGKKEAIEAVAEARSVGDADEEAAARLQNAADFADGAGEVGEMLQGVMAEDQVEAGGRERELVALRASPGIFVICERVYIDVNACDAQALNEVGKAAGAASEVENLVAGREVFEPALEESHGLARRAGELEDFENRTAVGIWNGADLILAASGCGGRFGKAPMNARENLALAGVGDEESFAIVEHALGADLIAFGRSVGHERIVSASHMKAAVVEDIERKLNAPIEHVDGGAVGQLG
jgi:hypothetical protein